MESILWTRHLKRPNFGHRNNTLMNFKIDFELESFKEEDFVTKNYEKA